MMTVTLMGRAHRACAGCPMGLLGLYEGGWSRTGTTICLLTRLPASVRQRPTLPSFLPPTTTWHFWTPLSVRKADENPLADWQSPGAWQSND
ncbi:hypothetical protein EDD16DRAFT_1658282 [Pisolithus croceorrhizus]|nr:hypothetical protein EDD16DRAFT_1658282 [Pisolithus croceorrhizus]